MSGPAGSSGDAMAGELFASMPLQLMDDAEGGIRYLPGVVSQALVNEWLQALLTDVAWQEQQRPMYDRIVDVPRLQASFALNDAAAPQVLAEALVRVQQHAPAPYTHVGLNLYRDGRDSVAMHNDRLHHLAPGQPIALLSLGATRDMAIRAKGRGARTLRIRLEPGSLLLMSHACQSTHDHGIPKTDDAVGPRVSCAFRVRRPQLVGAFSP